MTYSPGSDDSGVSMCERSTADACFDLFDFMAADLEQSVSLTRELASLAGPVDLAALSINSDGLIATISLAGTSITSPRPYLYTESDSSSESDDARVFGTPSSVCSSAGLKRDHFLYDTPSSARQQTRTSSKQHLHVRGRGIIGSKTSHATKIRHQSGRSSGGSGSKRGNSRGLPSSFAATVYPQVDKPCVGELNGKMPRPVVVNTTGRRRRKTGTVSREELDMEETNRKIKSVQSARDCRRRKKEYIEGLQNAIRMYDERETRAQHVIHTLRAAIDRLRKSADAA